MFTLLSKSFHGYYHDYSHILVLKSEYFRTTKLTHFGLMTPYGNVDLGQLVLVMACCLTAPSHYLNQCWLIISKIQLHSSDGNFTRDTSVINDWNKHENYSSKISLKLAGANELRPWLLVTRSSAAILTMLDKHVLVFHQEGFQQSLPSQSWEIAENTNTCLGILSNAAVQGFNRHILGKTGTKNVTPSKLCKQC